MNVSLHEAILRYQCGIMGKMVKAAFREKSGNKVRFKANLLNVRETPRKQQGMLKCEQEQNLQ